MGAAWHHRREAAAMPSFASNLPTPRPRHRAVPLTLWRVAMLLAWVGLAGCSSLPSRPPLPDEAALPATTTGALAAQVTPLVQAHPGRSGFVPLDSGLDAFAARVWLVDRASRSLDIQTYIWRSDRTGRWLLTRLQAAAERGVRVRLLLDDGNGSPTLDGLLAQLDAQPGAEVRFFNPYPHRGFGRAWDLATDFSRLHRRMHNKTFNADGVVTILGGRNVGDEYFGAAADMEFADLDVLAVGPIVGEVSASFDAYWNSASAYPRRSLLLPGNDRPLTPEQQAALDEASAYAKDLRERPRVERWRERGPQASDFVWGRSTLFVDPPDKVLKQAGESELMLPRLARTLGNADRSIDIVSPYFVPTDDGVAAFTALHERGVRLRVLTNSLAATDVSAVHAGYAPYRPALLDGGVELYELRAVPAPDGRARGRLLGLGSSRASLHAKTFAVDGERVFIGSFNFDPRSAWLNTEIGVLLEHPGLAQRIGQAFDTEVPRQAWQVTRDPDRGPDALRWRGQTPEGQPIELTEEPEAGWLTRLWVWLLSWLPIDGLL